MKDLFKLVGWDCFWITSDSIFIDTPPAQIMQDLYDALEETK